MKKNKLFKRTALALGTVATVAAPVAAVVSCGNTIGRYEGKDDKVIKLMVDYRKGKQQYNAISAQVDEFNKLPGHDFKVQLIQQYPLQGALTSTYQSQDKNKMVNLAITYPDTVGTVTYYGQQLDLSKTAHPVKMDIFPKGFTEVNDKIGGLDAGGVYALPITKSTDMVSTNTLVLARMLNQMGYDGTGSQTQLNKVINNAKDATHTDTTSEEKAAIATKYTRKTPATTVDQNILTDKIFTDGEALLDFAVAAGKTFDFSDHDSNTKKFAIGIDSATNFIYNAINSMTDGKADQFPFVKINDKTNPNNGYIEYHFKDAAMKAKINEIYEKMQEALSSGALFIAGTLNGQKEYASNYLAGHRMAISLGSTAGFNYNYKAVVAPTTNVPVKPGFVATNQKPVEPKKDATAAQLATYKTEIGVYNEKFNKLQQADQKLVTNYLDALAKYNKEVAAQTENPKSLNKDEMFGTGPISTFGAGTSKSILIQGPSLIGLHVTKKEDDQASIFVNWFINQTGGTSPLETFASAAGYLAPTSSFLSNADASAAKVTDGNAIAFNALKEIGTGTGKAHGFDNPVDFTTGQMRVQLQDAIHEQYQQAQKGKKAANLDEIYTYISRNFKQFA